jgi:hypothetical protein
MNRTLKFLFVLINCLTVLNCAPNKATEKVLSSPAEAEKPEFLLHRVLPGETMASIAKWYTGKGSAWKELVQYNPDLKQRNLKRGDLVKIPLGMAIVHNRQPKHSTAPKKHRKIAQNKHPEKDITSGQEEVFGPK